MSSSDKRKGIGELRPTPVCLATGPLFVVSGEAPAESRFQKCELNQPGKWTTPSSHLMGSRSGPAGENAPHSAESAQTKARQTKPGLMREGNMRESRLWRLSHP